MAIKRGLALTTAAALIVAGCSSNSPTTAPATAGPSAAEPTAAGPTASGTSAAFGWGSCDSVPAQQTLTIAMPGDVPTLDPHFSNNQISNEVNYNINDQFFRYGTKPGGNGVPV